MREIQKFWNELKDLSYMTTVTGYKDNKFDEILKKYKLKSLCRCCGK